MRVDLQDYQKEIRKIKQFYPAVYQETNEFQDIS